MLYDNGAGTAVALGLFDGVHLGHRAVLKTTSELGKSGLIPVCFTFSAGSMTVKHNEKIDYIYPEEMKADYIRECGISELFSFGFDEIRNLSPTEFVEKLLVMQLDCRAVVCGEDFHFGRDAAADVDTLKSLCGMYGIRVIIVPPVLLDGEPVSSARIRRALKDGRLEDAAALLGRDYVISDVIYRDMQNGRVLGYPTVNQKISPVFRFGVYRSETEIDGRHYKCLTNIGIRPTFENTDIPVAETHIIGLDDELYGRRININLLSFMRDEIKFSSAEELKVQIAADLASIAD